jgi:hypothetical protein
MGDSGAAKPVRSVSRARMTTEGWCSAVNAWMGYCRAKKGIYTTYTRHVRRDGAGHVAGVSTHSSDHSHRVLTVERQERRGGFGELLRHRLVPEDRDSGVVVRIVQPDADDSERHRRSRRRGALGAGSQHVESGRGERAGRVDVEHAGRSVKADKDVAVSIESARRVATAAGDVHGGVAGPVTHEGPVVGAQRTRARRRSASRSTTSRRSRRATAPRRPKPWRSCSASPSNAATCSPR